MSKQRNLSIFIQTVIMTSILLGLLLTAISFVIDRFFDGVKLAGSIEASGHLFVVWLVVSSAIRSTNRLAKGIPGWSFLFIGLFVAFGGILAQEGIVYLVELFKAGLNLKVLGFSSVPFFLGVGFVAALISLVNLRIRSRLLGNILELLIIAGIIYFFFFYMK